MWNYSFMVPSLLMMVTLLAFYFARRRLPVRMNRTYLTILVLHLWVVVFDLLSSKADENYTLYPAWLLYALNAGFFVLYLMRIYGFFLFTLDVLERRPSRRAMLLMALPIVAGEVIAVSSCFTGAMFSIVETGYQRGPLYDVLYVCSFFYILLAIGLLIANARSMKPHMFKGAVCYNLVLFVGYIVRILMPQYLVMNTFCMIAVLVIYLAFLNPDLYLSDRGSAFNMRGFRAMLRELLSQRRKYVILGFGLQNYYHERNILGGRQMDQGIGLISRYLIEAFPNQLSFYLRSGRYALLLDERADLQAIEKRLAERFHRPWETPNASLYLNVAFASVTSDANLDSPDRIVNNLVLALENANHVYPLDSKDGADRVQAVDRQVDLLSALERALDENQVEVFLQPVMDSHTRRLAAAEALARIRDAEGRIIPPGLFIPIAEKGGYINRLGEQVFEKTCAFIHDNDIRAMGMGWINVNLSPVQCMQQDLAERFREILERYRVSAELIHLEITEQSMIDYSQLRRQIVALKNLGFQFVLDDYGSGYSNLTRVKHYPFVNIKLDMEVVWDYFRDRDSLLPPIVQGFRQMNLSITAEGIENEEMADVLTEIGSDYLQGYLFSKPLPMDEFLEKYA